MTMHDPLSTTFAALADPTRRAILARLATGEATVGEIAEPFRVSLPAISRHLKVLENANLIVRHKQAQWRRCRLEAEPLREAADWVTQYREFWEKRFDALGQFLERQQTQEEENDDKPANGSKRDRPRRNQRSPGGGGKR